MDKIHKILNFYSIDCQIIGSTICLNVEDIKQLVDLSNAVKELDELMNFEYNYRNWKDSQINQSMCVEVFLKPNNEQYQSEEKEWKNMSYTRVDFINLSNKKENRLTQEEVFENIERSLVYKIKSQNDETLCPYTLPEETMTKYPAQRVTLNCDSKEYCFEYDVETGSYMITTLDPCQGFEGHYNYNDMNSFKELVELCGGTYTCDDWISNWTIDDNVWEAKLIVDEDKNYQDFELKKNNELVEISEYNGMSNGTVSGRAFSMEDVEKMLDVEFEIDQANTIVTMK